MEQPRYLTANPPGVRTYRDTHAFIAEDPQRQSSWDAPGDIRGWDVSDGFLLAELRWPDHRIRSGGSAWSTGWCVQYCAGSRPSSCIPSTDRCG